MTPRRSPKLYARPRAINYTWLHGTCSSKHQGPSPYSLRPPGCCKTCSQGGSLWILWTICDLPVSQKLDFMTFLRPGGDA